MKSNVLNKSSTSCYAILSWFLVASVIIPSIFFIIPFELYYPQRILWGEVLSLPLLFAVVGFVVALVGLCVFWPLYIQKQELVQKVSVWLFIIGLFSLLADVFAPLQLPPLDGWDRLSDQPLRYTIVEAVIAIVLVVWALRTEKLKLFSVALPVSICIWAGSFIYLTIVVLTPKYLPEKNANHVPRPELKNIYHILLDELQTDAMLSVLSDLKMAKHFKGFTAFPYNSSSYLFTRASFPNYMSGTTFHGDVPFQEWLNSFKTRGILPSLSTAGYVLSMNAPWEIWDNQLVSRYTTLAETMRIALPTPFPGLGDFMPVWMARVFPNFMTNWSLRYGSKLARIVSRRTGGIERYPATISQGREPFSSVLMLKEAIKKEKTLPAHGRYTYLHAVLPHGPYVMDGSCNFNTALAQGRLSGYYQQTVCGMRLVVQFINELKRLKRYDDSIIIVHADTGHGLRGFMHLNGKGIVNSESVEEKEERGVGGLQYPYWTKRQLLARTLSTLMIKPAGSKGPLVFSQKRSKLIDLYPTLMDMAGITNIDSSAEGQSLIANTHIEGRESSYYFYDPRNTEPKIQKFIWDEQEAVRRIDTALSRVH